MRGLKVIVAVAALALVVVVTSAMADPPTPADPAGAILGLVPAHGQFAHGGSGSGGSNLVYHSGPVMHTNGTYAIYWIPSGYAVSANYQGVISGFLSNVATDSGKASNVYASDTQ